MAAVAHCILLNYAQEGQTRYCARELINSEEEFVDVTRCDVFSLGASVYELCLGRFLGAEGEEGSAEWHAIR
jgi:serine/threonine protein kinase